jgi:hypothetical protein
VKTRELPRNWDVVALDSLRANGDHTFVGGPFGSDLTQSDYVPEPGVPVIRGTNLGGNESRFVDTGFVYVSEHKAKALRRNMAFPGDLIFTQRGTLGQVAIIPKQAQFDRYVISQSQMKLTPDLSKVDSGFLYHYFRTPHTLDRLLSQTQATGVPHINLGILKRFPVILPPLAEQRRIAEVLDRAEALRAKRRVALAQLDTLTQAIFLDLFGDPATNPKRWPLTTIGDVAEQVTDGEHLTPKRTTEGIKLLSARNIRDGYVDFGDVDYVGPEEYERIKRRCKPSPGDVLISCSGTIGRVASVETSEPFALVRSVALVRPKSSAVGSKFLEHYLRTPALKARMSGEQMRPAKRICSKVRSVNCLSTRHPSPSNTNSPAASPSWRS